MPQNGSILEETKDALGVNHDDFDAQIKLFINGVFAELNQLGVGPEEGFEISGKSEKWSDFYGTDIRFNAVQTLLVIRIKLLFDVFAEGMTSYVIQAFERQADRIQWRLNMLVEQEIVKAREAEAEIWVVDGSEPFPAEAPVGAIGFDPKTGMFWRKQS